MLMRVNVNRVHARRVLADREEDGDVVKAPTWNSGESEALGAGLTYTFCPILVAVKRDEYETEGEDRDQEGEENYDIWNFLMTSLFRLISLTHNNVDNRLAVNHVALKRPFRDHRRLKYCCRHLEFLGLVSSLFFFTNC